jgi:hypothetical protein
MAAPCKQARNFVAKAVMIFALIAQRNFYGLFYGRAKFCCKMLQRYATGSFQNRF